jgi:hypothetical protein
MNLTIELQGEILIATASGPLSHEEAIRGLRAVLDSAAERQAQKILFDCRAVEGGLSTMDRYDIASQSMQHLRELGIHVQFALVGGPPAVDGFGLQVAKNMGLLGLQFPNVHEARKWLERLP